MVLVDTSVWIEHFRHGQPALIKLLDRPAVLTHPFIVGELACGNLQVRSRILADLKSLPEGIEASHDEVLRLIEDRRLSGKGIGWIDCHLIASALITDCQFWTLDKRLHQVVRELDLPDFNPSTPFPKHR
jgi:hypothetical protein